jgi:hypothetical protein
MRWATLALLLCAVAGCDSGDQTLAWERSAADSFAPWFGGPAHYAEWPRGWPADPGFFPISVWMQNPTNAARYRAAGVNLYTGLWEGPTEEQLSGLAGAGMPAVCDQAGVWAAHLEDPSIQGWLAPAEPDNAQVLPDGSYGPCVDPSETVASYAAMVAADPSRPIVLVFGNGVVAEDYIGRGTCSGRSDMYPVYVQGGDVLAFGWYPVNQGLGFDQVAVGVDHLRGWAEDSKPVVPIVEASSFDGVLRPTPAQIRSEVWLALIHGAAGIQYYCHRWEPDLVETDCIDDAPSAAALAEIDAQITALAPVLNSPSVANGVTSMADVPVDTMLKRDGDVTYLFAVTRADVSTVATFTLRDFPATATADVIGEDRTIAVVDGIFRDEFPGYGVHLYRAAIR